tara:strand:+ start:118 stop:564 length:447 start_codon:yes stop_codon:yes gene_type:complete
MKTNEAKLVLPVPVYKGLVEHGIQSWLPAWAVRNEDGDWETPFTYQVGSKTEKRYCFEGFSNVDDEGLRPYAMNIIVGEREPDVREVKLKGDFLFIDGSHSQNFNLAMALAWANWKFPGIAHYVMWHDCEEEWVLWIPGVSYDEFIGK